MRRLQEIWTERGDRKNYIMRAPTKEIYDTDAKKCARITCDKCGNRGLILYPYSNLYCDEYLALADCHECGHTVLFHRIGFVPEYKVRRRRVLGDWKGE